MQAKPVVQDIPGILDSHEISSNLSVMLPLLYKTWTRYKYNVMETKLHSTHHLPVLLRHPYAAWRLSGLPWCTGRVGVIPSQPALGRL